MNYLKVFICSVFLLVFTAGTTFAQQASLRLKIMSFNVRMSGELTLNDVNPFAELIKKHNPDIIALQEVDYKAARSNNKDFVTELGATLGMFPVFGKTINIGTGEYGVAVLSKYPFVNTIMQMLPKPEGTKEQRGVLITEIMLPSGQKVRFASTHLDHSNATVRSAMVAALNGVLLKGDMPALLGGDFNARPDENTIATGMQSWKRICDDSPTYPDIPTIKIDYIFGYPKAHWKVVHYQVIRATNISDHCPLIAEIEYL